TNSSATICTNSRSSRPIAVEAALSPKDVASTDMRCLTPDAEKFIVISRLNLDSRPSTVCYVMLYRKLNTYTTQMLPEFGIFGAYRTLLLTAVFFGTRKARISVVD